MSVFVIYFASTSTFRHFVQPVNRTIIFLRNTLDNRPSNADLNSNLWKYFADWSCFVKQMMLKNSLIVHKIKLILVNFRSVWEWRLIFSEDMFKKGQKRFFHCKLGKSLLIFFSQPEKFAIHWPLMKSKI